MKFIADRAPALAEAPERSKAKMYSLNLPAVKISPSTIPQSSPALAKGPPAKKGRHSNVLPSRCRACKRPVLTDPSQEKNPALILP
jgi:hypothetical protein